MDRMFTSWRLGRLEVPNRLVRSATWEGLADPTGLVTDKLIDLTVKLAEGGVGLIIGGYVFVTPDGRGLPGQTGIDRDRCTESLAGLVAAVHRAGGLMVAQLAHAGGHTKADWIGTKPAGPSARFNDGLKEEVVELSRDRIAEIVAAFGAAASRAKQAGYDAVQLHGAHGYLISQFLSPFFNQRTDDYGGELANRARFVGQVYRAVRRAVGPDFPVFIKLNTIDGLENGLEPVEAVEVAKDLVAQGMDAVEVSGGVAGGGKAHRNSPGRVVRNTAEEGYFLDQAKAVKAAVACPVISVGGWRSPELVNRALESVDAVSLSRPLIREPNLIKRWRQGDHRPATCVSCGRCLTLGLKGGIACGWKGENYGQKENG